MIRQRDDVMQRVSSGSVVKVHRSCRQKFCDNHGLKNCICRLPILENDCVLVVTCYLCGKVIDTDVNIRKVTTFEIQQTVEHACVARGMMIGPWQYWGKYKCTAIWWLPTQCII